MKQLRKRLATLEAHRQEVDAELAHAAAEFDRRMLALVARRAAAGADAGPALSPAEVVADLILAGETNIPLLHTWAASARDRRASSWADLRRNDDASA